MFLIVSFSPYSPNQLLTCIISSFLSFLALFFTVYPSLQQDLSFPHTFLLILISPSPHRYLTSPAPTQALSTPALTLSHHTMMAFSPSPSMGTPSSQAPETCASKSGIYSEASMSSPSTMHTRTGCVPSASPLVDRLCSLVCILKGCLVMGIFSWV